MAGKIKNDRLAFVSGRIEKPVYIKEMYEKWHKTLFEYADALRQTNVKRVEIMDDEVVVTTRDRGIRFAAVDGDRRIAPIAILNFCDYEKDETRMIESLVEEKMTVLDVGANIGWYSLNLAVARRQAKIHAFEPVTRTFEFLQKNIQMNKMRNITAYNMGFSRESAELPMYYYPEGSGNASLSNLTGRESISPENYTFSTIDRFAEQHALRVDFIKCDVEGAELLVCLGGIKTIKRDLPIIFSEMLRKWSAKFDYDPNEIFALLGGLGYRAFTVVADRLCHFSKMTPETLETNFFFLHADRHKCQITRWSELRT